MCLCTSGGIWGAVRGSIDMSAWNLGDRIHVCTQVQMYVGVPTTDSGVFSMCACANMLLAILSACVRFNCMKQQILPFSYGLTQYIAIINLIHI